MSLFLFCRDFKTLKDDNCIWLGKAIVKDFETYRQKVKKSPDELIRFFLHLDIEPGQTAIPIGEDVAAFFYRLKTSLNLSSTDLMKYLFEVYDRYVYFVTLLDCDTFCNLLQMSPCGLASSITFYQTTHF